MKEKSFGVEARLELVTLVYETQNVPNSVLAFLIFEKSEI